MYYYYILNNQVITASCGRVQGIIFYALGIENNPIERSRGGVTNYH